MSAPLPLMKSWWVTDNFLAGPVFFSGDLTADVRNLAKLEAAGISTIISLVGLDQYYSDEIESEIFAWAIVPRFVWYSMEVEDGSAPGSDTMQMILQWIDVALMKDRKVYLHCHSGRGRTGTVVGCWLARHSIALGDAVIDHMAELRAAAGLSGSCPETPAQIELVTHWRRNQ